MDTLGSVEREVDGVQGSSPARLLVAGVRTPILTQVTRRSSRGMTVEQALPFLQLHTQVLDDAQQSSRIESVSVVVYDGVPRLVLDLAYDEELAPIEAAPAPTPRRAHAGVVRPRVRPDATESYAHKAAEQAHATREQGSRGTLPYEAPREATQVFSTQGEGAPKALAKPEQLPLAVQGLKLSVMEQELLQPKDFVFHVRTTWERARPHLRRAGWQAQAWSFRAYRWALPRAVATWSAAQALAVRGARAAAAYVARKRAARAEEQASAPTQTPV